MIQTLHQPILSLLPHVGHAFFTRSGGASTGDHEGLSVSTRPENATYAPLNLRLATQHLGLQEGHIALPQQVHGKDALQIDAPFPFTPLEDRPQVDSLITSTKGLGIAVNSADCVPLLLAHENAPVIASVHAGWKGALSGIVEETLSALKNNGARCENLVAALGPHIFQDSYEVGEDVRCQFTDQAPSFARFFKPNPDRENHFFFDLGGVVIARLKESGVARVAASPWNTYTDRMRFYSCRRAFHEKRPSFGCLLSTIWIRA